MKLTDDFAITIRGNTRAFVACPRDLRNLEYAFTTLFSGGEIAVSELESWGLEVREIPSGGLVGWGNDIPPEFRR